MPPKDFLFIQFDRYTFSENPKIKDQLAQFYCNIWMYDPNFGEYRQCPVCKQYFNEEQVEVEGITTCDGSAIQNPHPLTSLSLAWEPEFVKKEILDPDTVLGDKFFGAVAVDPVTGNIVGFTWGKIRELTDIEKDYGSEIANLVRADNDNAETAYYSEIATDPAKRGLGIGSRLCRMLTSWMKKNYPNLPGLLRTHKDSPARRLFEKSGFVYFTDDTMYGGGRIMLKVANCRDLTPENL